MGICIAYKGKLRAPTLVTELVNDISKKAAMVGWRCETMANLIAMDIVRTGGLDGISLYPSKECEPLHLHFDRDGTFVNHGYYTLHKDPEKAAALRAAMAESAAFIQGLLDSSKQARHDETAGIRVELVAMPEPTGNFIEDGMRYNWTKTQFAGARIHAALCALLRYIKERYAPDLEITDDSGYYIDHDYAKLEGELAAVDHILALTAGAVRTTAAATDATSLDGFIEQLNHELANVRPEQH